MARFVCPKCRAMVRATSEAPGTVLVCDACGQKLRVPAAKSNAAGAQRLTPPRETPEERIQTESAFKKGGVPPPLDEVDEPFVEEHVTAEPARRQRPLGASEDDDDFADIDDDRPRRKKKRPKSANVATLGGGLFGILCLVGFLLFISGKWAVWIQEPVQQFLVDQGIHPIVAIAAAAAVVLIPLGLLYFSLVKSTILGAMPNEIEFRSAKASDYENLDRDQLAELTAAFEELGFRRLMDYAVETDIDMGTEGFARLLVHDKRYFAEINQVFARGRTIPMRCMIMSLMDQRWSVAVTNRTSSKEGYLMRLPRALWRSIPDAEPDELFEKVRKLRQAMIRDLDVEVLDDDSAKSYFAREKANTRARKASVAHRWALGIQLDFWLFDRNPKREWLGEYAAKKGRGREE